MAKRKKPKPPQTPFERFVMLARKIVSVPKPDEKRPRKPQTS